MRSRSASRSGSMANLALLISMFSRLAKINGGHETLWLLKTLKFYFV
jgi:hypothetical protein